MKLNAKALATAVVVVEVVGYFIFILVTASRPATMALILMWMFPGVRFEPNWEMTSRGFPLGWIMVAVVMWFFVHFVVSLYNRLVDRDEFKEK